MKDDDKNYGSSNNQNQRPDFWLSFLQWFCPADLFEGIEGDLLEQFEKDIYAVGKKKAKRRFIWNIVRFFRPEILFRNRFSVEFIQHAMVKNYIIVAYRNLLRYKLNAAINILGLSLGISSCLLIGLYVFDELSFDRFHKKSGSIFRVLTEWISGTGQQYKSSRTPYPLAQAIRDALPEAEQVTRLSNDNVVVKADNAFFDANLLNADPEFFKIFTFPVQNPTTSIEGSIRSGVNTRSCIPVF